MVKIPPKMNKNNVSYVKLQDAFVAEKGIKVGTWKEIGYLMKNSSNFYFCDVASSACTSSNNTTGYGDVTTAYGDNDYEATWKATNIATLNDCAAGSNWSLTTSQNDKAGGVVLYTALVGKATAASDIASDDCGVLTPTFANYNTK